jgi:hypothetical protein
MNFDSDKVPEKKTQGITPFPRKSKNLPLKHPRPPTKSFAMQQCSNGLNRAMTSDIMSGS